MRRFPGALVLALLVWTCSAAALRGQTVWDAPFMTAPGSPSGVTFLLVDPHPGQLGFVIAWRNAQAPGGLGFRAGIAEDSNDDLSAFGGVDFSGMIAAATADFPVDVIWVSGFGAGVGDIIVLSVPLGLILGRVVRSEDVTFTPYGGPRLVLDAFLGDDRPNRDEFDLDLAIDIGVDLSFGATWSIRFGATLGDRDALGIGVNLPGLGGGRRR